MTKAELRKTYLQRRKEFSPVEYATSNRQIAERFFSTFDLARVSLIHIFLPIAKKKEPDTRLIIERIRVDFRHARICVPRINPVADTLDSVLLEKDSVLTGNSWGIDEVQQGIEVDAVQIDLVVVPLLAFDDSGHRVGYGKGYYDKFLARCRKDVRKVGLSAFSAETQIEGVEPNDVPLDYCITPERVYIF